MNDSPNPAKLVFAADLGGTHLRMALVDATGKIHRQSKQSTPKDDSPDRIVETLVSTARAWSDAFSVPVAAAVMVPGAVDNDNAIVIQAPNLPSLVNFELKKELEHRLGWPVFLENDANAAAIGEMWQGAARGCTDVVSVTLGTGVGGGVILNDRLWRGSHGSAGEIGHTTVDPFAELKCKCGNRGCLELFASATAIVRMTREDLSLFPESLLHVADQLTAEQVYEAGIKGDKLALAVFKRAGMYLGIALANLMNVIDPQMIVITGGVVNGWDLFAGEMYRQVRERSFRATAQQVRVTRAECGDNAGVFGAARIALTGLQDFSGFCLTE